jgi:glycosyltransferase involved in cell wall biosynthesis
MGSEASLTILIPCFNEESSISQVLDGMTLLKQQIDFELIVIDDGSTDKTLDIINSRDHEIKQIITLKKNAGKGRAIVEGLRRVSSEYVLIQDADLEYNYQDIFELWKIVLEHSADVVMSTRLNGARVSRVHYFWHKIGNRIITFVFNILNNTTFTDIYSGYIIFKPKLLDVDHLVFNRWGQQAEILTFLTRRSSKIYESPIAYFGRTYDEGKKIRFSAVFSVVLAIFLTRFKVYFFKKHTKYSSR